MIRMRPQIMKLAEYAEAYEDDGAHCTENGHTYQHGVTPTLWFTQVTLAVSD
jgi:hypothetical protein